MSHHCSSAQNQTISTARSVEAPQPPRRKVTGTPSSAPERLVPLSASCSGPMKVAFGGTSMELTAECRTFFSQL
ncbi:hypothetical protein CRUP_017613 [Coryphaenoides rupestris]|nr:hypothetical protein CRUP_017613 [Coryphaenoides rupestris]